VYRLGDLLSDAVRALIGPRRARQAAVLDAWPEVVGEVRARHARAAGIRGTALVVVTDLPAVSHEIRLRRDALVEALNQRAGGPAIEDIQVVIRLPGESVGGRDGPERR
jgi:predicted nucleic acid-binding Zn ribbon protein